MLATDSVRTSLALVLSPIGVLPQDERGHDLRADEPPDVEKTRSRLTLLAQLLVAQPILSCLHNPLSPGAPDL